jgi:ABC-type uncharacterized transport system fused permease/ATPase subunit
MRNFSQMSDQQLTERIDELDSASDRAHELKRSLEAEKRENDSRPESLEQTMTSLQISNRDIALSDEIIENADERFAIDMEVRRRAGTI